MFFPWFSCFFFTGFHGLSMELGRFEGRLKDDPLKSGGRPEGEPEPEQDTDGSSVRC